MASIIDVQVKFEGKSPIVAGTNNGVKRLTITNLWQLLFAMLHGSRFKGGNGYIQWQSSLVAASATATPASVANGDTLSIAGTALTAAQRRATGYVTAATAIAGDTFAVNGVTFTAVAGAVVLGEATFDCSGNDAATATSIIAQFNAYVDPRLTGVVKARATVGNTARATFYAVTQGTAGNSITLAGTAVTLAASGATLANGAALANNTFDWAGTDITTGQAIAAAILASTTAAVQQTTATASSSTGVVTVTAKVAGVAGNAITFTSSDGTRLAVTGSGFLASGSAGAVTRFDL